ncbi:MAG: hypothetical protein V6Z81_07245 [Parvularculales bacterium]
MKKIYLIITLILIVGALTIGYNYWINTPEYSLLQIQKSIENKDRYLFEKHVDTENIIEGVIADITEVFLEEINEEANTDTSFFDTEVLAQGLVVLLKPVIASAIIEGFDEFWEKNIERIPSGHESGTTSSGDNTDFLKTIAGSAEMTYLNKNGNMARVGFELTNSDTSEKTLLELKLIKTENYWKISEISNLQELLRGEKDNIRDLIDIDG